MYGKIFEIMYDGSLYGQWEAIVTFQQMIVLADKDGFVDITPPALSARTSIPLEIIKKGIEILESEDPYTRTTGEDGKRIVRIDEHRPWGWEIVNYKKYRDLASKEELRERARLRKQKQREREKSQDVTDGHSKSQMSHHTDTDTDINTTYERSFKLSNLLYTLILKNNPKHKKPNLDSWSKVIDLMIRIDNRDPSEIEKVIKWCQQDEFWHTNILSTTKLRKQYDQLALKMKSPSKKSKEPEPYNFPECKGCGQKSTSIKKGQDCPYCGEMV